MTTYPDPKGYVVIVIDDFGNRGSGTKEMFNLDTPITAAVMPFLSHSFEDAKDAYEAGLEVILHLPMEPVHGKKEWLGPRGITCNLKDEEIKAIVSDGLSEIKFASGMNNHMGSKATQDNRVMKAILEVAKKNNLFFLDSKTSPKSVVSKVAAQLDIPYFTRDIFLDGTQNKAHIEKQILKLGKIALDKGYAIGIGHVGVEGGIVTAEAIRSTSHILKEKGIEFIPLSKLKTIINKKNSNTVD